MAVTLNCTLRASLQWALLDTLDLSTVGDQATLQYSQNIANGTAVSTADLIWHDTRTLAAAANDDLDLNALTQSIFGTTVTKAILKVKAIVIAVTTTTSGYYLKVGASGGNEWIAAFGATGDLVKVGANSVLVLSNLVDGWAVVNGATDLLRINNPSAGPVTYNIAILGTSV